MVIEQDILKNMALQGFEHAKKEAQKEFDQLLVPGGLQSRRGAGELDPATRGRLQAWERQASEEERQRRYYLTLFILNLESVIGWIEDGEYLKALERASYFVAHHKKTKGRASRFPTRYLQSLADDEWTRQPELSVRAVALRLSKDVGLAAETIRKRIEKRPVARC